ncbi:MAG: VOC family protein [Phycisphaerales bacterium]|nr:VOC family protein [Phycisphaerales bacterium]
MKCTHIAIQTRDIEASIRFYVEYCGMRVVHDRHESFRVVWMGWGEDPPRFVIVLLDHDYERNEQPPYQHIGIAVDSRAEVDAICARAKAAGLDVPWEPADGGEVVGYFGAIRDPDWNMVEFSFGQRLG